MNTTQPKASPCASCPWLAANQTPDAVRNSPRPKGSGFPGERAPLRWFDPKNLRQKWAHIRTGGMLPCHMTDQRAPLYGGKKVAGKVETRVCAGLSILARREVFSYLTAGGVFRQYTALGGRRFTLDGLAQWAARLAYPGAMFEAFSLHDGRRALRMPDVGDTPDVCVPWDDAVSGKQP